MNNQKTLKPLSDEERNKLLMEEYFQGHKPTQLIWEKSLNASSTLVVQIWKSKNLHFGLTRIVKKDGLQLFTVTLSKNELTFLNSKYHELMNEFNKVSARYRKGGE